MILPDREPSLRIIAQLLPSGRRTTTRCGGGQCTTDQIARRIIGRTIAIAGRGDGMGMGALSIVVTAGWSTDQPTIDVVAVALLILRSRQGACGDAGPTTRRRSIGP